MVAAFMQETQAGYDWAVDHPDEAADLLIAAGEFPAQSWLKVPCKRENRGRCIPAEKRARQWAGFQRNPLRRDGAVPFRQRCASSRHSMVDPLEWPGDVSIWSSDQEWMGK